MAATFWGLPSCPSRACLPNNQGEHSQIYYPSLNCCGQSCLIAAHLAQSKIQSPYNHSHVFQGLTLGQCSDLSPGPSFPYLFALENTCLLLHKHAQLTPASGPLHLLFPLSRMLVHSLPFHLSSNAMLKRSIPFAFFIRYQFLSLTPYSLFPESCFITFHVIVYIYSLTCFWSFSSPPQQYSLKCELSESGDFVLQ